MAAPSYCCTVHKRLGQGCCFQVQQSSRTELDTALHELGMLSTVTNSRKEYLKEKQPDSLFRGKVQDISLNRPKPCIIKMNSNFVTDFTFSPVAVTNNGSSFGPDHMWSSSSSSISFVADNTKGNYFSRKVRSVKTRHLYRPYDFPWRPKLLKSLQKRPKTLLSLNADHDDDGAAPPALSIVARQDSGGNKSNPGSPIKSQKPICSSGSSIVRSRSLDDLEIGKLNLTDCCSNEVGKADIDNVSQWINNLHVS